MIGTMFGGVINLANMLPYGTFCVCESETLQQKLYEELSTIWDRPDDSIPSYQRLATLTILV